MLAWALTCQGKLEQAANIYEQLTSREQQMDDDLKNYGYCLWFQGQIPEAINHFKQFLLCSPDKDYDMEKEFMQSEHAILAANNISDLEIQLMLDSLA